MAKAKTTVKRRAYEYDHEYGLPVKPGKPAGASRASASRGKAASRPAAATKRKATKAKSATKKK